MIIREVSDLHLEFFYDLFENGHTMALQKFKEIIPPLPSDKKTVLIVAGDLASVHKVSRIVTFLEFAVPRFRHVIYVLGNHEHYNSQLLESEHIIEEAIARSKIDRSKLTIAGNTPKVTIVGKIRFICGTLWTNYYNGSEPAMLAAKSAMNDHRLIKNAGGCAVTPVELMNIFNDTVKWFEGAFDRAPDNKRVVVVTHHMPTLQAVDPQYMMSERDRLMNGAFASDLDDFILKHQPAYWFFGHTHSKVNMKIGETQLICNPLGYPAERNFDAGRFTTQEIYSL